MPSQEPLSRGRLLVLAAAIVLLMAGWVAATAPYWGNDEAAHFDRAITLLDGELIGPHVDYDNPGLTPAAHAFINHDTTAVRVPKRLMIGDVPCIGGKPNRGSCLVDDPNGNFPPLGYALPAAAIAAAPDSYTGLWLSRGAAALQSVAFLLLALALLWDGSAWSVLGLAVVLTPMVFYSSATMTSSGIEICSCIAFLAALAKLARSPATSSARTFAAVAVTGVFALLTGPIDVAFVAADLVVFAILIGWGGIREVARRRAARVCAALLAAAFVLAMVYSRAAGFSERFGISPIRASLKAAYQQLQFVFSEAIGNFSSETVPLPLVVCILWWALMGAVVLGALVLGRNRERVAVVVAGVIGVAFPVLYWAWIDRYSGFGLQGREVLPILVMPAAVGGVVIHRHRPRIPRPVAVIALPVAFAAVALMEGYGWWRSARNAAGAPGTTRFWAHATWAPPLGWWPWIAFAAAGVVLMLGFAAGPITVFARQRGSVSRIAS